MKTYHDVDTDVTTLGRRVAVVDFHDIETHFFGDEGGRGRTRAKARRVKRAARVVGGRVRRKTKERMENQKLHRAHVFRQKSRRSIAIISDRDSILAAKITYSSLRQNECSKSTGRIFSHFPGVSLA